MGDWARHFIYAKGLDVIYTTYTDDGPTQQFESRVQRLVPSADWPTFSADLKQASGMFWQNQPLISTADGRTFDVNTTYYGESIVRWCNSTTPCF
jgi:hypothetical protein